MVGRISAMETTTKTERTMSRAGTWSNILAIASLGLGYYWYIQSDKRREPCFVISPPVVAAISPVNSKYTNIERQKGELVTNMTYSITMYYWNKGREPIHKSDILKPLLIKFSPNNYELLESRIIKQSRDTVGAVLIPQHERNNCIQVSFDLLEENDGFAINVVFNSTQYVTTTLEGIIAQVHGAVISTNSIGTWIIWEHKWVFIGVLTIIGFFVFMLFIGITLSFTKDDGKRPSGCLLFITSYVPTIVFVLGLVWAYENRRGSYELNSVPTSICISK